MDLSLVLRGAAIGFAVAAPVGPIGLLVVRRSIAGGALPGLATGLGAAAADTTFALAGSLGLAEVAAGFGAHAGMLRVAGAIVVVALGLRAMFERARPRVETPSTQPRSLFGAFATTLVLTLTNPMTILSFAAVAAGAGIAGRDALGAIALSGGVLLGSAAWWLVLAGSVAALRRRIPDRALPWIGRASGVLLVAFGVHALIST